MEDCGASDMLAPALGHGPENWADSLGCHAYGKRQL